jgi:hypothetical protein
VCYAVNVIVRRLPHRESDPRPTVIVGPGHYDVAGCTATPVGPVTIIGVQGSNATVMDCGGTGPFLSTRASVVAHGLTVARCRLKLLPGQGPDPVSGGAGIQVAWPAGTTQRYVRLQDVVFVGNSVVLIAVDPPAAGGVASNAATWPYVVGGAGLLVSGGGSDCYVSVVSCAAFDNSVTVHPDPTDSGGSPDSLLLRVGGAGVSVHLGLAHSRGAPMVRSAVTIVDFHGAANSVLCDAPGISVCVSFVSP